MLSLPVASPPIYPHSAPPSVHPLNETLWAEAIYVLPLMSGGCPAGKRKGECPSWAQAALPVQQRANEPVIVRAAQPISPRLSAWGPSKQ